MISENADFIRGVNQFQRYIGPVNHAGLVWRQIKVSEGKKGLHC